MDKKSLELLEKALKAETEGRLCRNGIDIFQTRSKRALELVEKGYLKTSVVASPAHSTLPFIEGYRITDCGRMFLDCRAHEHERPA
jgi:hypothetical protein